MQVNFCSTKGPILNSNTIASLRIRKPCADGVLADEATALVNHISRRLAQKWERPYSVVVTEFRRSISFALVRAAFNCTFNARSDPARDAVTFEDGAALH